MKTESDLELERFPLQYVTLLSKLLDSGVLETNQRTGQRVKILPGGCSVTVDLSDNVLPTAGVRRTYPKTSAAEIAWFLQGTQDVTWLKKYAPIWSAFAEEDGKTVLNGYGYRWRNHFGRDQVALALEALAGNPTNRRVYVGAWDPASDGLGAPSKNVPCPLGFQLMVYGRAVHMYVPMRSLDILVGLPYDVMTFALLLSACAYSLNSKFGAERLRLGTLRVTAGHAHLYESHWDIADRCCNEPSLEPPFQMPTWSVAEVTAMPDAYVERVRHEQAKHTWPDYSPKPEVHP